MVTKFPSRIPITVTGTHNPSSVNICVMPALLPKHPTPLSKRACVRTGVVRACAGARRAAVVLGIVGANADAVKLVVVQANMVTLRRKIKWSVRSCGADDGRAVARRRMPLRAIDVDAAAGPFFSKP